jgi:ABC-type antimicrobial peptide transport system permease subunit
MHVFMLLALQRRQVIGIMRSLGATRLDVVALHAAEAVMVGLGAGVIAVAASVAVSKLIESVAARWIEHAPLAPDSLFIFTPLQLALCVALAVFCCVVGGVLGVLGTARKDPIELL